RPDHTKTNSLEKIPVATARGSVTYTRRRCECSESKSQIEKDAPIRSAGAFASSESTKAAKAAKSASNPGRLTEQCRRKIADRQTKIRVIQNVLEVKRHRQIVFGCAAAAAETSHHAAAHAFATTARAMCTATTGNGSSDRWAAPTRSATTTLACVG